MSRKHSLNDVRLPSSLLKECPFTLLRRPDTFFQHAMSRKHSLNDVRLPSSLLKEVSTDRLCKLNEDEVEFTEFLDALKLDDLKTVQKKQQQFTDENFQLAVLNAEKESEFEQKKALLRSKILEMTDATNEHDKKYEELKSWIRKTDSETVLKNLQKALRETEKSSEEMADEFIAGTSDLNMEKFAVDLHKQRVLYWLRKVKAEKMEGLLKSKRPIPVTRSPQPRQSHVNPPYLAPMPNSHPPPPIHSLPPTSHAASYPPDPRRPSDPGQSMPPYYQAASRMPMPNMTPAGHPFPAATFSYYRPPPQPYPNPTKPAPYSGQGYRPQYYPR